MDPLCNYIENLNADPERMRNEIREHAGKLVARTLDGRRSIEFGGTIAELVAKLRARGIDPADLIFGHVPSPNESAVF